MALASIIPSSTRREPLPTTLSPCLVRFRCARFPSIQQQEETDVWGTLTKENSVIFHDNDVSAFRSNFSAWFVPRAILILNTFRLQKMDSKFEIFVDAEGSNHNYKEVRAIEDNPYIL